MKTTLGSYRRMWLPRGDGSCKNIHQNIFKDCWAWKSQGDYFLPHSERYIIGLESGKKVMPQPLQCTCRPPVVQTYSKLCHLSQKLHGCFSWRRSNDWLDVYLKMFWGIILRSIDGQKSRQKHGRVLKNISFAGISQHVKCVARLLYEPLERFWHQSQSLSVLVHGRCFCAILYTLSIFIYSVSQKTIPPNHQR